MRGGEVGTALMEGSVVAREVWVALAAAVAPARSRSCSECHLQRGPKQRPDSVFL